MIVIAAVLIGALVGWRRATALQGNTKDRAQYAAAFAMAFGVVGLIATVILSRVMG